jgi:hypothetical protein
MIGHQCDGSEMPTKTAATAFGISELESHWKTNAF